MSVCRVSVCIAAILLFCTAAQAEKQSSSYSKAVRQFCRADYKKYCGEYGLETTALRSCMDRNGKSLSKGCVRALVKDGYISQADVNRRKKAAGR
jgi:predicted lipoprotein